jgi:hypothetical protein
MSARGDTDLADFGEFLECIRPDRLEKPPSPRWSRSVPADQRLGDEVGDALVTTAGASSLSLMTAAAASSVKPAGKTDKRHSKRRSDSGTSS